MSVDIEHLDTATMSQETKQDNVRLLCQSLLLENMVFDKTFQRYEFRITVHRLFDDMCSRTPAQTSPQRLLLEPLTELHSVPHFEMTSTANAEYCNRIAAQVSRKGPTT